MQDKQIQHMKGRVVQEEIHRETQMTAQQGRATLSVLAILPGLEFKDWHKLNSAHSQAQSPNPDYTKALNKHSLRDSVSLPPNCISISDRWILFRQPCEAEGASRRDGVHLFGHI